MLEVGCHGVCGGMLMEVLPVFGLQGGVCLCVCVRLDGVEGANGW